MAKLYDTIKLWADGQNALDAAGPAPAGPLHLAVERAVGHLQRHGSLADLATAYYDDEWWWRPVAQEFGLGPSEARVARGAAYWQRFMQIRHPAPRRPPR